MPAIVAGGGLRALYGIYLGQVSVSGGASIDIHVDMLLNGDSSTTRAWYDGIGYALVVEDQDTDGDGLPDAAEFQLGTDPLDPGSYFFLAGDFEADGTIVLTWPSKPGISFEIRSSPNLSDWSTVVEPNVLATDPGSTTSYTIPASESLREFYRIILK